MVITYNCLANLQYRHLCELQQWRNWFIETFPNFSHTLHHSATIWSHSLGSSHPTILRRKQSKSRWFVCFESQRSNLQITDFLAILYQLDPNYQCGSIGLCSLWTLVGSWMAKCQVGSGRNCAFFGTFTSW